MAVRKFRSAYKNRVRVPLELSGEPTRVKQEFKKECDINEIVARMKRGVMPPPWMTDKTPSYGDFSKLPASFSEAFEIVSMANEAFMSLPLEFRRALDHDPRRLDSAPRELYEAHGLLKSPISLEAGRSPAPKEPGSPAASSPRQGAIKPAKAGAVVEPTTEE